MPGLVHRAALWAGLSALSLLILGFGGWGFLFQVSQGIVLRGTVEHHRPPLLVASGRQASISEILVAEGQVVGRDEPLLRLSDPALLTTRRLLLQQRAEVTIRHARLAAELNGQRHLSLANGMAEMAARHPDNVAAQQEMLVAALLEQDQARESVAALGRQIKGEIAGLAIEQEALEEGLALISARLEKQELLVASGAVSGASLMPLWREKTRLEAELGRNIAQLARSETRRAEALRAHRARVSARRVALLGQLADLDHQRRDLAARLEQAEIEISGLTLRAESRGIVQFEEPLHAGQPVAAGRVLVQVIPDQNSQKLRVLARPDQATTLALNDQARLVFPGQSRGAGGRHSYGRLVAISPGRVEDGNSQSGRYELLLEPESPIPPLRAGSLVDVFFKGTPRRPLALLVDPLTRYFERAFRES